MAIPNEVLVDGMKNGKRYVGFVTAFAEVGQYLAVVMELPGEHDEAETLRCSSESFVDKSHAEQWVYEQWQKLMGVH